MNLTLNTNLLSGSLPSSIINCTQLLALSLSFNRLTGELPQGLGGLSKMTFFSVANNSMSGNIPDDIFDCLSLETLDLGRNNFSGPLKPSIGKMSNLRRLQLHSNSFKGEIPPEIGNLSRLFTVQIDRNRLSGKVPSELSKLSLLQDLSLHDNALEGEIPEELFKLKRLTILELQNNQFDGVISDFFSKLELLSTLNLSGNKFQGFIPRNMTKLTRLTLLDLSHNSLSGAIPGLFLASMKGLQSYLNLSHNSLSEKIPEDIGMLEMVQSIDLSSNNFSGQVPATLKGCRNLLSLDLSVNQLSGNLQEETFDGSNPLTSINLSRNQINGQIPASMAKLTLLNSLDLSQNKIGGKIPEKLGELSSLKFLNLSYNHLEGAIPQSGVLRNIPASSYAGNKRLCGTNFLGSCTEKNNSNTLHRKTLLILIPLVCSALLLIAVVALLYKKKCRKSRRNKEVETPELDNNAAALTLRRFDSKEIETATDHFSENQILGNSNLSTVYQGRFEDGQIVAIKRLNLVQFAEESNKSFYREAKILSQLRHRNLVKVIGYAWESRKLKALVLEYMENGNLERLSMILQIKVFISIAKGLAYLHSGYDFPIIHCDLKPSNILLDGDWEAHVSDFGTARMLGVHLPGGHSSTTASAFKGTIGYIAPEFAYMRTLTTKVDIFSFGVIIMEFLTKQRPTSLAEEGGSPVTLSHHVEMALAEDKPLYVIDSDLTSSMTRNEEEIVKQLLQLALFCTSKTPEHRPHINSVLSCIMKLETTVSCQDNGNDSSELMVA
ncbi:LRR receptor-like serine/threonine-protein kinase FLS2 [Bienertia sinuspersici]